MQANHRTKQQTIRVNFWSGRDTVSEQRSECGLRQKAFGQAKSDTLPKYCRECEVRFACNGECPRHRFEKTPDGEEGLNYLCAGYKKFFKHIDPTMRKMADLMHARMAPASIMGMLPLGAKK